MSFLILKLYKLSNLDTLKILPFCWFLPSLPNYLQVFCPASFSPSHLSQQRLWPLIEVEHPSAEYLALNSWRIHNNRYVVSENK